MAKKVILYEKGVQILPATAIEQVSGKASNGDMDTATDDTLYTTPLGVKRSIDTHAMSAITPHIENYNNPHKVTAAQTGAYWSGNSNKADVDWACNNLFTKWIAKPSNNDSNGETLVVESAHGSGVDKSGGGLLLRGGLGTGTGTGGDVHIQTSTKSTTSGSGHNSTHTRLVVKADSGNVGIGTTTPTEALDVNGNIKGSNLYTTNLIIDNHTFHKHGLYGSITTRHKGSKYWDAGLVVYGDVTTPEHINKFGVFTHYKGALRIGTNWRGGLEGLSSEYTPIEIAPSLGQNSLYIKTNGNVGLSTDNPTEKLHVEGNGLFTGTGKFGGDLQSGGNILAKADVVAYSSNTDVLIDTLAGAGFLYELGDVTIDAPKLNDFLVYNADTTNPRWVNKSASTLKLATLDTNSKIPLSQLPDSIIGGMVYQGTWNAATNTPDLTTVLPKGQYYIVSTAGIQFGVDWNVGDWIVSHGDKWDKIDNTDQVTSVAGRQGAVVLTKDDVGLNNVRNVAQLGQTETAAAAVKVGYSNGFTNANDNPNGASGFYLKDVTTGSSNWANTSGTGLTIMRNGGGASTSTLKLQLFSDTTTGTDLMFRRGWGTANGMVHTDWFKMWHSGNSNRVDVDWTCKGLTSYGSVSTNLLFEVRRGAKGEKKSLFYKNADNNVDYGTLIRDITDDIATELILSKNALRLRYNNEAAMTVYHAGNSNLSTVDWNANSMNSNSVNSPLVQNLTGLLELKSQSATLTLADDGINILQTNAGGTGTFEVYGSQYVSKSLDVIQDANIGGSLISGKVKLASDATKGYLQLGGKTDDTGLGVICGLNITQLAKLEVTSKETSFSGNVAVGKPTATSALDVNGTIKASADVVAYSVTSDVLMDQTAAGASSLIDLSDVNITNPSIGQTIVWNPTANKWENKAVSWSTLSDKPTSFTPTAHDHTGGSFSVSDKRLKVNIQPIENVQLYIKALEPVKYDWKPEAKSKYGVREDVGFGFIAQDVEKIIPDAVRKLEDGEHLGINYEKIIPFLVGSMQEMMVEIRELKEEVEKLKNK